MPKLFIGNIPHTSEETNLRKWVESYGFPVDSVEIIHDRVTGKSRGFGFVALRDESVVDPAVSQLNGRRMGGRILTVCQATSSLSPTKQFPGDKTSQSRQEPA